VIATTQEATLQRPSTAFNSQTVHVAGIIAGDLKLIFGTQRFSFWQAPVYPNMSGPTSGAPFDCESGCLFNVTAVQHTHTHGRLHALTTYLLTYFVFPALPRRTRKSVTTSQRRGLRYGCGWR
jgi:hypothetical protein